MTRAQAPAAPPPEEAKGKATEKPAEAEAKPKPPTDAFIDSASTEGLSWRERKDLESLARSKRADVTQNRDGSSTRTRTTASTTRELTTKDGVGWSSNLKFESTRKNGDVTKKDTFSANTDLFRRTETSQSSETTVKKGDVEKTSSRTHQRGALGLTTEISAQTTKTTHEKVADSTTSSKTTAKGFASSSMEEKKTVTEGKKTTESSSKTTKGTSLSTASTSGLDSEKGTYSVGSSASLKKENRAEAAWKQETEKRTVDKGFSQKTDGKLDRAQRAGDVADAMGFNTKLYSKEFDTIGEEPKGDFVGTRAGTKGETTVTAGAGGVNAKFSREATAGAYAQSAGKAAGEYGTAGYTAKAAVEAQAKVDGKGKLDLNGLDAGINAKAGVLAEASIRGKAETKPVKVAGVDITAGVEGTAKVSAEASAEATGKVKLTRNPPAAIIEGTVGASAVVKAEAEAKVSAGPFAVKGGVYGSAGAEAKATGVFGYEDGKLKIGGSAGAALGLGAGANVSVEVNVKQIGDMAKNTADVNHDGKLDLADAKAAGQGVVDAAKHATEAAKEKVQGAANTVKDWFGL